MNRSSTDRAEARLSLTIFLTLSFLGIGLFALTTRSVAGPGRHPLPPDPQQVETDGSWNVNASGNWSDTANWLSGNIADGIGATGNFQFNLTSSTKTVTLDSSRTLGSLNIGDNTSAFQSYVVSTANASILTFNNTSNSANAQINKSVSTSTDTISVPISLISSLDITNSSTGTLTLSTGGITAGSAGTKTITTSTGNVTSSGVIGDGSGTVAVAQNGPGTLALGTSANTYSGGTTISGGKVTIGGSGTALGSGALTLSGGTLVSSANRSVAAATNVVLAADSALTTTSTAGTAGMPFSGTLTGTAGALTIRNDASSTTGVFDVRFSGGDYTMSQPIIINNGAGGGTARLSDFNTTGTTHTYDGVISGSGSFRRSATSVGTGGLTAFNAANTYTGGTAINDGMLIANTDGALGAGDVTINEMGAARLTLQGGAANNYISDSATLTLVDGAVVNLNFKGTDAIGGLVLGSMGPQTKPGTYGGSDSGAMFQFPTFFSGTGTVSLGVAPPPIHFEFTAPANAIAGSPFSFTVTAKNSSGQIVTDYAGTVHFTKSDSGAGSAVPADYTFVAGDNGTHTFTNGATFVTAGNQTITATDTADSSIIGTSGNIAVTAAGAGHLAVSAPGSATAGTPFSITVTARDQFNNTATGYRGTVHFTKSDNGAGSLVPGDYTFLAGDNGIHTFGSGVTFVTVGNQTVTATDTVTSSITGTSSNVAVSAGTATHFTVSAPGSTTANTPFNFTVTALDQFNNVATGYSGTVHFTSSDGLAVLPADNTLTNGTGTFSATLNTAGNQTITATDKVTSSITGTSNNVLVGAAGASHFAIITPANATAGTPFSITVTALDQFNNTASGYRGTAHFTKSDSGAGSAVPANYTFTSGDNGIHIFTNAVTFVTAGNQTVTATDTVTGSITGTSNNVLVSATTATRFTVTAPATVPRGTAFNFTVTALDQFNNTATGYGGTVHFTSSDGSASLPPDNTLTNGTRTFSATLNTAGTQTITATDTSNGSITGTSNNITVSSATHFSVSAPASATAGTPFSFTVTALDASNMTVTNYSGTVHFTKSDSGAGSAVPADYTFVAGDNGTHTFTNGATLVTAGNQTITATDTVSSIAGTSGNISVTAIAATHLAVSAPANATAGTPFSITVTAQDQFNNTATGYRGTVHFTKSDSGAGSSVPANYTFTAGDNGVHTFTNGVTFVTAGSQTVTATDTVTGSITGTSNNVAVSAATATHFSVVAPAAATAGTPFNFTVTAFDQFNNIATGYSGTAHFTKSDSGAGSAVPADYTFVAGDNGTHTFTNGATFVTAGNQTITATDKVTSSITGTSNLILVSAGTATHFAVIAPSNATAGSAFNFTVTAKDQFNNTATGYTGTVQFTSSDGQAVLPANSTLTNGTKTFSATLKTSGNQTITGTDTVTNSITGASNNIAVSATAAVHLAVSAPGSATAGTPFNFAVTAQDQFGNTATGYAGTVHFSSSDAQAALPANSTLISGTRTFSATLKIAGNQTITGTDTVTSSITGTSATIVVSAGAATHFILIAPGSATPNVPFNFTVTAKDQFNNTATGYTGTVHFTSTDAQAVLPSNSSLTNGTGIGSATLNTVGNQTITATDTVTISITGTSNIIVVSPNALITSPVPGSVLPSGSNVRFDWSGGINTTAYWLIIGDDNFNTAPCGDPSKVGGSNVFSSGSTGGLFWNVGGLPTDGRTLYVRLWSKINNVWYSPPQDYIYTASGSTPYTPVISPDGGTFTNSVTVTLTEPTPCTTIYYTINGGDPTPSSTPYATPFPISGAGTKILRAKAFRTSGGESTVSTATFTIH